MLVSRSRFAAVENERDEWRRRAEARPRITTRTEVVVRRSPLWTRLVAASWLVLLGLLVGGAAIPRADDAPTLLEDYPACVAAARDEYAPATDRYQEFVNALYACGVYEVPVAEG